MIQPSLSTADAFALAFLPAAAGVAPGSYEVLDAVAAPSSPELAHAVQFGRGAVKISESKSREAQAQLTRTAARCGLTLPDPPAAASAHRAWLETVRQRGRQAVSAASRPSIAAAFEVGIAAGDLYQALWIGRSVVYLRTAAPAHPGLRQRATELDAALDEAMRRLGGLVDRAAKDSTGADIMAAAIQLRKLFAQMPDVPAATSAAAFSGYFEWANAITVQLEGLGAVLPA